MIVLKDDLDDKKKLKYKVCSLCGKPFVIGESYEKITTKRKSKLIIHTDCIKKGI